MLHPKRSCSPIPLGVLALGLWFSMGCFAYHGDKVFLARVSANHYMDIWSRYGFPIRYYISPELAHIHVTLDGQARDINASFAVDSALNHWAAATAGQEHPITLARVENLADAELVFRASDEEAPNDTSVMFYHQERTQHEPDTIVLVPNRISSQLQQFRLLFHDTNADAYVNNVMLVIMFHASGHALGLLHPDHESNHDIVPVPHTSLRLQVHGLSPQELIRPHIMMRSPFDYLLQLETVLNHTIGQADVFPADAEYAAIRFNLSFEGQCPPDPPSAKPVGFHAPLFECRNLGVSAWVLLGILLQ